jgi:hypothetical protein
MTTTEESIFETNVRRVVDLGRAAGWDDDSLGALLALFDPALVRVFAGADVYLHDGRLVGRVGVIGTMYDRMAWAERLDSLDATPRA